MSPQLGDRIVGVMRYRNEPLCVSCVTKTIVIGPPTEPPDHDFNEVLIESHNVALRRSYGLCADCGRQGVRLHPSS